MGSQVVRALDLQLHGCEFNLRPWRYRVTTLGKLSTPTFLCRLQWFSDGMIDCGVRGCGQLCLSRQPLWRTALGTGCAPYLQCLLPKSTQPSTLHRTLKWVSAFGLSNNNKWRWWMWTVAAISRRTNTQVGWLGLRVGSHLVHSLHSSNEPGELSQWPRSWKQHH